VQRRKCQQTESFKDEYAKRAGVEGTMSQGVRRCDIRPARYRGLPKTRLQHLATAAALNLVRIANWLDEPPLFLKRTIGMHQMSCCVCDKVDPVRPRLCDECLRPRKLLRVRKAYM
jgi:hypothetical protein